MVPTKILYIISMQNYSLEILGLGGPWKNTIFANYNLLYIFLEVSYFLSGCSCRKYFWNQRFCLKTILVPGLPPRFVVKKSTIFDKEILVKCIPKICFFKSGGSLKIILKNFRFLIRRSLQKIYFKIRDFALKCSSKTKIFFRKSLQKYF